MNKLLTYLSIVLILCSFTASASLAASVSKEEFVGVWLQNDTHGKPFQITLNADGTGETNWGPGEVGTWELEGNRAICTWNNGWVDIITKTDQGFSYDTAIAPDAIKAAKPVPSKKIA